jgi:hypothetical protein
MIIHWGRPIPGWLIFTVLVVVLACAFFYPPGVRRNTAYDLADRIPLDNSLPHYRYTTIEDSLKMVKYNQDYFNNTTAGMEIGSAVGIASYKIDDKRKDHFLTLDGYYLEDFTTVENKISGTEVQYYVWDKAKNEAPHSQLQVIPIKFRKDNLGYKNNSNNEYDKGKLYFPIRSSIGITIEVMSWIFTLIVFLLFIYIIVYAPIRLLLQLAKGRAFTEENIGSMYFCAWILIVVSTIQALMPIIAHLLMRSKIPSAFHFSYYDAAFQYWKIFAAGLAVLLFAKAFLQGMNLKEEQELTI